MKKLLLSLLCAIALSFTMLYANPVEVSTAKQIGEKFIKSSTIIGLQRTDIQANLAYTLNSANGEACIFVFNIAEGGFVIVSAEDHVKPILGYSTEGYFDINNIADGFRFNLASYQEEIEYVRNHNIALTDDIANEWESVASTGRINESKNNRAVAPLLDLLWNQGMYYNNECPEDTAGPGGRVYAGCVATAMSMVMKYWNYPAQGTGNHSYTPGGWGYPSYPTQSANFGETLYHFELMPTYLDSTSTEEEIFYIAQLQHHCGISVDMMYSANGSGAYSDDVPGAMSSHFRYNPDMDLLYKDWYYGGDWSEMLKIELNAARPIYYCGQDDNGAGGHAYVCDGYDENNYFHFNWGWGGRDNGYFAMGALNTTRYAFNTYNGALQNCFPADESYYSRPQKVTDISIEELDDNQSIIINWTNPSEDLSGNALNSIDSVIIRRNFHTIMTFADANAGEEMEYTDMVSESGVYEYSVLVKNENGYSIPVYQRVTIGAKCDLVFELNDEAENGWRGASISIVDESGRRLEVIEMTEGATETRTIPLLQGELSFIWNPGWYSAVDDHEISFSIYDKDNNLIFNSPDSLAKGLLFSFNNDCADNVIENKALDEAQIFPNPSNGFVTIKASGMNQVRVYDIVGQEVVSFETQNDTIIIDLTNYENGVYFIQINTNYGIMTKKFILSR